MAEQTQNEDAKYFSTVLRKDVYGRLTEFAKSYQTGMGYWDYGVAIQFLLDFYEQNSSTAQTNVKLDIVMSMLEDLKEAPVIQQENKKEEEPAGIEMLGGEVLK